MPRSSLAERTALVTGAGRGLGRAVALALAGEGAAVALLARSPAELEEAAAAVRGAGARALALPLDLADAAAIPATVARIAAELGPVDVLVNNAATLGPVRSSAGIDSAEWARALAVNLTAAATLGFALLPPMLERGWGRIVNVSSGIVEEPEAMPRGNAYVTSKAALEAHTVNLAAELAATGVTVNAFRPGILDTSQQSWLRAQDPAVIGAALHRRYTGFASEGRLIGAERSAAVLVERLRSTESGRTWTVPERVS